MGKFIYGKIPVMENSTKQNHNITKSTANTSSEWKIPQLISHATRCKLHAQTMQSNVCELVLESVIIARFAIDEITVIRRVGLGHRVAIRFYCVIVITVIVVPTCIVSITAHLKINTTTSNQEKYIQQQFTPSGKLSFNIQKVAISSTL